MRHPQLQEADGQLSCFDVVLAHPPFSLNDWGIAQAAEDPFQRYAAGLPPKTKADYAFLSHICATLAPDTGRAVVLAPMAYCFGGKRKKIIRQAWLERTG